MNTVKRLFRAYLNWSYSLEREEKQVETYKDRMEIIRTIASFLKDASEAVLSQSAPSMEEKNVSRIRRVYETARQAVEQAPDNEWGIGAVYTASWELGWELAKEDFPPNR